MVDAEKEEEEKIVFEVTFRLFVFFLYFSDVAKEVYRSDDQYESVDETD